MKRQYKFVNHQRFCHTVYTVVAIPFPSTPPGVLDHFGRINKQHRLWQYWIITDCCINAMMHSICRVFNSWICQKQTFTSGYFLNWRCKSRYIYCISIMCYKITYIRILYISATSILCSSVSLWRGNILHVLSEYGYGDVCYFKINFNKIF